MSRRKLKETVVKKEPETENVFKGTEINVETD